MQATKKSIFNKIIITLLVMILILSKILVTGVYMQKVYALDEQNINNENASIINQEQNREALLQEEVESFIPFETNKEKGIIFQTKLNAQLINYAKAISKTSIEIQVPEIEGIKPNKIKVSGNIGLATDEPRVVEQFDESIYDKDNNKIIINIENENKDAKSKKIESNRQDEYIITYYYYENKEVKSDEQIPEETSKIEEIMNLLTVENNEGIKIKLKANLIITLKEKEEQVLADSEKEETINGKIGNLVEVNVETSNNELSKGYIYNNYDVEQKQETEYEEIIKVNVRNYELANKIELIQNPENFITENNESFSSTENEYNNTYFKQLTINKNQIKELLGENGKIQICGKGQVIDEIHVYKDEQGNVLIKRLSEETAVNENMQLSEEESMTEINEENVESENVVIDLSNYDTNDIKIETTKPIKNGEIQINLLKAIKQDINYSKMQVLDFKNMQLSVQANIINENNIEDIENQDNIDDQETNSNEQVAENENIENLQNNQNTAETQNTIETQNKAQATTEIQDETQNKAQTTPEIQNEIQDETQDTTEEQNTTQSIEETQNLEETQNIIETNEIPVQIALTEPETTAELIINKQNLSTVILNENVEIRAILNTNSLNNKLFRNPVLTITLPEYIENIDIKNVEMLFEDELKIKSSTVQTNENGTKSIIIELEGNQTKYNIGAVSKGANIVIIADITVNKLTPNMQSQIAMTYTNSNVITKQKIDFEEKQISIPVNFVAPVGVIATNTISIQEDNLKAVSLSGEENVIEPVLMSKTKTAQMQMSLINNYSNTIDDIQILGRFPFEGNKDIITEESLNSSINMKLQELITVENIDINLVDIYYSENGEATKDLSLSENGWSKTIANIQNVKSYLIVIKDYTLNPADKIDFTYKTEVPENMQYNESSYQMYVAYFDNNNEEIGKIEDKIVATKTGVDTGTGPVLESKISSNIDEDELVEANHYIKYTATITNKGTVDATDVVANIEIPTRTKYVEYSEITNSYNEKSDTQLTYDLGTVKPQETKTIEFTVKAQNPLYEDIECDNPEHFSEEGEHIYKSNEHTEADYKINVKAILNVTLAEIQNEIKVESNENTIRKTLFILSEYSSTDKQSELSEGMEYTYKVIISLADPVKFELSQNIEDKDNIIKNVIAKIDIPEGLKYESANVIVENEEGKIKEITYNEKIRELEVSIGDIIGKEKDAIEIKFLVEQLPEGQYERQLSILTRVRGENTQEVTSNKLTELVTKAYVTAKQTSTVAEGTPIAGGDYFSYIITLKNIGERGTDIITVKNPIPEYIQFISTTYTRNGEEYTRFKHNR